MPSRKNAPEWFGGTTSNNSSMPSSKSKSKSKSSSRSSGGSSSGKRSHRRSTSLDSSGLDISNHSANGSRRGDKKSSSRKKHTRKKSLGSLDLNESTSTHNSASSSRQLNGSKHSLDSKIVPMPLDQQEAQKQQLKLPQKMEGNINVQTNGITEQQSQDGGKKIEKRPSFVERFFGIKSSQKSEATSTPVGNSVAPEEQKLLPEKKNEHGAYGNEHPHRDNLNDNNVGIMSLHQQMSQTLPTTSRNGQSHGQQAQLTNPYGDTSMRIPQEPYQNAPLHYQHQHQHQHQYPYDHTPYYQKYQNQQHSGMDQDVYRKQPFAGKGPYIEHSATYPAPRASSAFERHGSGSAFHSGTDSDDLFMYSEDESMTTPMPSSYPMQYGMNVNPFPYGTYSYEGYQNRESFEVREHQQMMALAPSNRHITSFAPASSLGSRSGESKYGSLTDSMHTHSPNDMYISEDETLMSESSKMNSGGYRRGSISSLDGLSGFPSGIFGSSNNMVIEEGDEEEGDEAEAKTNDGHGVSSLMSHTPVDHLHHREEAATTAATATVASSSKVLNRTYSHDTDAKSSNSGSAGGGGSNNSGGSKARSVTIRTVPSNYSSGSSTGSGAGKRVRRNSHKKQKSPTPKRQSPPPPVTSVKVHKIHNRNFSSETNTTGSTSIPSPANTIPPKLTRKEYKRLTKRLEAAELREDRVQTIIRSGHEDALEWSMHVPQHIRGMSRAAGFFPNEEIKLHDVPFAILFLVQLGVVISLAVTYANETVMNGTSTSSSSSAGYDEPFGINTYSDDPFGAPLENWAKDIHVDYKNAFNLSCITALYATSLSALSIGMMMILGKALIPTVLCLGVIICIGFATIGSVLTPYSCIPIIGLLALILSLGYSVVVWERIPFASTNLNTALCGVKSSADVLLVAFVMMIMAFLWTIGWAIAFLGVYDVYLDKNSEYGVNNSITWYGICIYVGMCISYFWTINVMNVSSLLFTLPE